MLKAVFFDLDGTLLPMDENDFIKFYFGMLCKKASKRGYEPTRLIDCIWSGTKLMMANTSDKTNEEVFWNEFSRYYGKEKLVDKEIFDEFYKNEFYLAKGVCKENPLAKEIVTFCRENLKYVICSTNPIFPYDADVARLSFINLKIEDFDFVTTYENFNRSKPNPEFFIKLMDMYSLKPDEVIVFGNNEDEDYLCAKKAGITCYLVGDYIMKLKKEQLNIVPIKMDEVIDVIKKEIERRK